MKKNILLIFLYGLASCGSTKQAAYTTAIAKNPCPQGGTCTVEVLKNKSLQVLTDDFKRPYYHVVDAPGNVVVKYRYTKTANPEISDSGYTEELVFETDSTFNKLNAINSKLLFGIQCFCRGKAGYYTTKDAGMDFKKDVLYITLPDVVEGQRTKNVEIKFEHP